MCRGQFVWWWHMVHSMAEGEVIEQQIWTLWITNALFSGILKLRIIQLLASINNYKVETEIIESKTEVSTKSCHFDVV
jgi:hypothetical protein